MAKYRIRFNKSRGAPGRGSMEHVWRIFEGEKEYIVKHFRLECFSYSEKQEGSEDWNVCCDADMTIDRETSTATFKSPLTLNKLGIEHGQDHSQHTTA